MNSLERRYPDLLGQRFDRAAVTLVEDLDQVYAAPLPAQWDAIIARSLEECAASRTGPPARRQLHRLPRWMRHPLAATILALLGPLLIAGGVYAAASLVDQALSSSPATRQIVEHHLGQEVAFSRSACGFTVTINRLYADPHRVIIGYTVTGPPGRRFFGWLWPDNATPVLTDAQGDQLIFSEGMAGGGMGSETGQYMAFDAGWLPHPGSTLSLRLTLPAIRGTEQMSGSAQGGAACEKYSRVGPARGLWFRDVTVRGPFSFDFTVPVASDMRVANLHMIARAGSATVTLERVELAPSDTRVYWRDNLGRNGVTLADELAGPNVSASSGPFARWLVRRDGNTFMHGIYIGGHHGLKVCRFDTPGYDYHGDWTLLVSIHVKESPAGFEQSTPITFHFKVP